jgi:hypothetical protein
MGVKNWPKKCSKINFQGGVPGGQNDQNSRGGSGGVDFINFLKFRSFLQKLPPFLNPKMAPIKMSFPTNRLYFSQKSTFMGGPGGGPLGPKNVDTTI